MNLELIMQNLQEGIILGILGMGVVMIFLTLMMYIMKFTEQIMFKLNGWFPEEVQEVVKKTIAETPKQEEEIAAAVAAVAHKELVKGGV